MALKEVSPQKGKIQHKLLKLGQALTHKIIIIFCYILNFYIQNNDFMRMTFFLIGHNILTIETFRNTERKL